MKKLMKVVLVLVALVTIGVTARITVLANSEIVDNVEKEVNEENQTNEDVTGGEEDIQNSNEDTDGTFTYKYTFLKLDYYIYCMGHNKDYNLVYTVNGGEEQTGILSIRGEHIQSGVPKTICLYYEFPNVKAGDVIEYKYSYLYTYGGFPEERGSSGTIVVEGSNQ